MALPFLCFAALLILITDVGLVFLNTTCPFYINSRSTYIPGVTKCPISPKRSSLSKTSSTSLSTMANPCTTRGRSTAALARTGNQSARSRTVVARLRPSEPSNGIRPLCQTKKSTKQRSSSVPTRRRPSSPPSSPPPKPEPDPEPNPAPTFTTHPLLPPNNDLESMMEAAASSLPAPLSEEPTIEEFAQSLINNPCLFGDEATTSLFKNFSVNSKLHEMMLEKIEERFFYVLSKHPNFKFLTDIIDDPELPGMTACRFYVAIRGVKKDIKKKMLNYSLILKKKYSGQELTDPEVFALAQYEPNTVDTNLCCLFGIFKNRSIVYSKGDDFKQRGDFPAYWRNVFELTRKVITEPSLMRLLLILTSDRRDERLLLMACFIL